MGVQFNARDPDWECSDYVEIDPSARYGRVIINSNCIEFESVLVAFALSSRYYQSITYSTTVLYCNLEFKEFGRRKN